MSLKLKDMLTGVLARAAGASQAATVRAAPIAIGQIKQVSNQGDLDAGIAAEKGGFATAFGSEDAKEGISAFLGKRTPKWGGK